MMGVYTATASFLDSGRSSVGTLLGLLDVTGDEVTRTGVESLNPSRDRARDLTQSQ
jgi:hypothetical protein